MACAINASCLALMNAALPMKYPVAAVHCVLDAQSGQLVLDPSQSQFLGRGQDDDHKADFTFAFAGTPDRHIITCYSRGQFSPACFQEAIQVCRSASDGIFTFYRESFKKFAKII